MYECMNLKLIVTTKPGKERVVELQIGDSLYHYDPRVRIVYTRYRGVILVYSHLSPWQAFWKVMGYPIHGASRIVPVEVCVDTRIDLILDALSKLLDRKRVSEAVLEVVVRGNLIDEHDLKDSLQQLLMAKNIKLRYKADHAVKVEVADNITGLALIPRGIDKVSRKIREILRRIGHEGLI